MAMKKECDLCINHLDASFCNECGCDGERLCMAKDVARDVSNRRNKVEELLAKARGE